MIDYALIVRLRKQGMSINAIASAAGCKWDTVSRILLRCEEKWDSVDNVPDGLGAQEIKDQIISPGSVINREYLQPDPEKILERQRKEGKSRNELWADYCREARAIGKQAYKLSRFNEIVTTFAAKSDISCRQRKAPGVEAQVDWVGDKGHLYDSDTGERIDLHLIVVALPYSGYFFVKAYLDEKMPSWLDGHKAAFEFFGGCPAMMVPDNCRTAVSQGRRHCSDEAVLNPQYARFMEHYNVIVAPARIRHPKDKSVVERCVQVVERDLMKQVDELRLGSLEEYNRILEMKLRARLERPYTKRMGSRASIFNEEEKAGLLPLPVHEYQSYTEKEAVVGRDFHIQYKKVHYSVPADYIKEKVIVRDCGLRIRIYNQKGQQIAEHAKSFREWDWVTDRSHEPERYGVRGGYSPEYFLTWAQEFGETTSAWVRAMLERYDTPARSFNALHAALRAARDYDQDVVEMASSDALASRIWTSKQFKALLSACQKEKAEAAGEPAADPDGFYAVH